MTYGYDQRPDVEPLSATTAPPPDYATPPTEIPRITAANLNQDIISARHIVAGTITAEEIAANTITASLIAAGTITAAQIAAGTITAAQIAAGSITATEIAANTITADEISSLNFDASFRIEVDGGGGGVIAAIQAGQFRLESGGGGLTTYGIIQGNNDGVSITAFGLSRRILLNSARLELLNASSGQDLAFFGGTGGPKPTISGNTFGVAALEDLLTELDTLGLVNDTTSWTAPTVSGTRGANAALADLLTELDTLGLVNDTTTAGSVPQATSYEGGDFTFLGVTQDFSLIDAGSVGATGSHWIEVEVNGTTGYLHVFVSK